MERSTRLLLSLSMLGTAACVPDAVTGPEPAAPAPETPVQSASDAGAAAEAAAAPKSGPRTILLRGSKSVRPDRSAELLHVIDGVVMTAADALHRLDAGDVESIEVLKRTSMAAFYGNRNWDAVVLITTRSGRRGRRGTDANAHHPAHPPIQSPEVMRGSSSTGSLQK